MAEVESFQESVGFAEVAIFMAPTWIVFNSEAKGIVLDWVDNACFFRLKDLEIGGGDGFVANQIVQTVQKPAAERIAVRAFFWVQLENEVVVEDLRSKSNDEWSDVASDVAEMSNFNLLRIIDAFKDALYSLNWFLFCGYKDIDCMEYFLDKWQLFPPPG